MPNNQNNKDGQQFRLQDRVLEIANEAKGYWAAMITLMLSDISFLQDESLYPDDEYLQVIKEFRSFAEDYFDNTSYLTERQSIEECFVSVVTKHHFPEDKLPEAIDEAVVGYIELRIEDRLRTAEEENWQGELPPLAEDDIDTVDMAYLFAYIPYIKEDDDFCQSIGVTYDYDQLHMAVWFSGQVTLGSGNYSRRIPNPSAKQTYNRLLNPYSLLWIGTALGEDKEILRKAAEEMETKDSFAGKCGVVRKYVPFSRIYELASALLSEEAEGKDE